MSDVRELLRPRGLLTLDVEAFLRDPVNVEITKSVKKRDVEGYAGGTVSFEITGACGVQKSRAWRVLLRKQQPTPVTGHLFEMTYSSEVGCFKHCKPSASFSLKGKSTVTVFK